MKKFINTLTLVEYEVQDDKADWFVRDADFKEVFEMPEEPKIMKPVKQVKVKKSKVVKKVLKPSDTDK